MTTIDVWGPAFPVPQEIDACGMPRDSCWTGMTLRDYFAAKAMQGLMAHPETVSGAWHVEAKAAYEIADAMIAAREATP